MYSNYWIIPLMCLTCLGGCSDDKVSIQEAIDAISRHNPDPITVTGTASIVKVGSRFSDPDKRVSIKPINPRDREIQSPQVFSEYSAQDRLMTKRAATADAYRKLVQAVYDLKVSKTQTVRDKLSVSDSSQIEMQLQHHTVQPARYLEDGTVQVDVSLALADAVELLRQNHVASP